MGQIDTERLARVKWIQQEDAYPLAVSLMGNKQGVETDQLARIIRDRMPAFFNDCFHELYLLENRQLDCLECPMPEVPLGRSEQELKAAEKTLKDRIADLPRRQKNRQTHKNIELVGEGELEYCRECHRGEDQLYERPCHDRSPDVDDNPPEKNLVVEARVYKATNAVIQSKNAGNIPRVAVGATTEAQQSLADALHEDAVTQQADTKIVPQKSAGELLGAAFKKLGIDGPCMIPPPGWRCTRERGHDGPCAAVSIPPSEIDQEHADFRETCTSCSGLCGERNEDDGSWTPCEECGGKGYTV